MRNLNAGRNKNAESGVGPTVGAGVASGMSGAGGGEGDEGAIKLSSQIGSLFEIMTNILKMSGIHSHRMILDPISKLVIYYRMSVAYTTNIIHSAFCRSPLYAFYYFRSVTQFRTAVYLSATLRVFVTFATSHLPRKGTSYF